MVMPEPEGDDAARVMAAALKDAGLSRVDYINAHATSTKANDAVETKAIKAVFGQDAYRIPVSSTKSMTPLSASLRSTREKVSLVRLSWEAMCFFSPARPTVPRASCLV